MINYYVFITLEGKEYPTDPPPMTTTKRPRNSNKKAKQKRGTKAAIEIKSKHTIHSIQFHMENLFFL